MCQCMYVPLSPPTQRPPTDPLYSPALPVSPLCVCEDGVGFIPALHLFSPPQWLYHWGEKCCFTEERKWRVWLCPPGSQRWDAHTHKHTFGKTFTTCPFLTCVCVSFDLRSSLLIWVTECGSACSVTESTTRPALVNTQFVYSDALGLLCVCVCLLHMTVWLCVFVSTCSPFGGVILGWVVS